LQQRSRQSSSQLALPPVELSPFGYASIADVVLSMRYTPCNGGAGLRKAAAESVLGWAAAV